MHACIHLIASYIPSCISTYKINIIANTRKQDRFACSLLERESSSIGPILIGVMSSLKGCAVHLILRVIILLC